MTVRSSMILIVPALVATQPVLAAGGALTAAPSQTTTMLERHISYFDDPAIAGNGDGYVKLRETAGGLKAMKRDLSTTSTWLTAFAIHAGLGPLIGYKAARARLDERLDARGVTGATKTLLSVSDAMLTAARHPLRIRISDIKEGIHAADTGIFDKNGDFVQATMQEKVDDLFARFDRGNTGAMNQEDFNNMIATNKALAKAKGLPAGQVLFGSIASPGEFTQLLKFGANTTKLDSTGKVTPAISRARVLEFYEGNLFYTLAAEQSGVARR
jgi:hypothetical protein